MGRAELQIPRAQVLGLQRQEQKGRERRAGQWAVRQSGSEFGAEVERRRYQPGREGRWGEECSRHQVGE